MKTIDQIKVIYDGECPFCKHFALKRIIEKKGIELTLIDARSLSEKQLDYYRQQGFDLNKGMLAEFKKQTYYGNDALMLLINLSKHSNWLSSMIEQTYKKVSSPSSYKLLVKLRFILLKLLQKRVL
ncbi:DUF393 domain-containing protein [Shewanella sp. 202IG2-18]|uniref:DCC1-like thiol-disulfide oxidoreductase family protein n=1 Tax=Parashewanella hymeniacidonis TaxID=2807618 RepID=UPI00195FD37A|nr:DCC1-like thiol-disulfide oxidoreductase family protein [Parashewanella hymeniacidonis]MBM7071537.1 DUF393 domain-containing protein [Parashewanella hymeniacidonis]